jgi:hypothetical protein
MCEKKPYCNREIDACLREEVACINEAPLYTTILSCCGHEKYPKTVVVRDNLTREVFEWFTGVQLAGRYGRETGRYAFYKRDGMRKGDHYYLPEVLAFLGMK